jgi:exoribonuclease R
VPNDQSIPTFLVPFEIKNMGFSKIFKNMYVTVHFDSWNDKHPIAKLGNIIGDIDIIENYYEYQLHCKGLNSSIQQFNKNTLHSLNNQTDIEIIQQIQLKYSNIENRTNLFVFTIDPQDSKDFDDGFSIQNMKEDNITIISIYISNVTLWVDHLNLWDSFSKRISTIYLPDKKRTMLPPILSDNMCSLIQSRPRVALAMDIFIKENNIIKIEYKNTIINVAKNYIYEEVELLNCIQYNNLFENVEVLSKYNKYTNELKDSHDLVCYLMVLMNHHCAKELLKFKTGIFRSTIQNIDINMRLKPDLFVGEMFHYSGHYIDGSKSNIETRHETMNLDTYIHITSPIRRIIDLLNMIQFQRVNNMLLLSEKANNFYDKWVNDIEYINSMMKNIKQQGFLTFHLKKLKKYI